MPFSRRDFLQHAGGLLGAGILAGTRLAHAAPMAMPMRRKAAMLAAPDVPLVNPVSLAHFVDPLPIPSLAQPAGTHTHPGYPGRTLPYYRMEMRAFEARLHRDLPPTPLWGYAGSFPGPTIRAAKDAPLLVEWVNALPSSHFLPIDHGVHGAERDKPDVRAVAHVHGAKTAADSDGFPEAWFAPGQSALYAYPNAQDASTLWYHDHALGITRLNIYAGLAGAWIIDDAHEQSLGLPAGDADIPLLLCDRFVAQDGQLYYPVSDDPAAPWVMQCNGNLTLCNGRIFPYHEVEPKAYRFRLINAANSSYFDLSLSNGRALVQIGSDQGLLPAPAERARITLYPAERAEVLLDFSGMDGQTLILRNQEQDILQWRVRDRGGKNVASFALPAKLRDVPRLDPKHAVRERLLTLEETDDADGNAMQMLLDGKHWHDPVAETPRVGDTEIWSFINLSGDTHPIHLHLVRFQVLDRRPFDLFAWATRRKLVYTDPAEPPPAHEAGWKDTVRCDPGLVTRIIARFDGEPGRYVWHCHMLEHEDNDMMRPFDLLPAPKPRA